jgi:hypothetical protein
MQTSGRSDPAISLAVEGLRAVQTTCADLISANSSALSRLAGPGSEDGSDRCELVTCADIEHACLLALGVGSISPSTLITSPTTEIIPFGSSIQSAVSAVLSSPPSSARRSSTGEKSLLSAASNSTAVQKLDAAGCAAAFSLGEKSIGKVSSAHAHPVTDIIVLHEDDSMPEGFEKLTHSVSGTYPADLNAPSGPKQLWLAIARFPTAPAITGLVLVAVDQGEFVPPGYTPVKRYITGRAADLHYGTPNPQLVLCYARQMGAPIVDFSVCFPNGALALSTMVGVTGKSHLAGPTTRGPLGGTAANIAAAEANRARMGMFGGLGQITTEIVKGIAKLGPPKEDLPPSYAALSHSLLGADVSLTGGSAKGSVVLCYAKDMTHIDALSNSFDDKTPTETAIAAITSAVKRCPTLSTILTPSEMNLSETANQSVQSVLAALTYGSTSSLVVPLPISRKRALLREKNIPSRLKDEIVLNERASIDVSQQKGIDNGITSSSSKALGGKAIGLSLRSGLKAVGKLFNIAGDEKNITIKESSTTDEESGSPRLSSSTSSSSSSLASVTAPTPTNLMSPTANRLFGFGASRMRHGGSISDPVGSLTPSIHDGSGGFGSSSAVPTLPSSITLEGFEGVDDAMGSSSRARTGTDIVEVEENDHDLLDGFDADDLDENGVILQSRAVTLDSADSAPTLGSRSGSQNALSLLAASPGEGGSALRSSKSSPSLASRGNSRPGSPMNGGLSARSRASSGIAISTAIAAATIGNAPLRNANQVSAADTSMMGGAAGSIDAHSVPAGPSGLPIAQDNEESLRRFILFRHMSWILSPAASKICVESSRYSSSNSNDISQDIGLSSFLLPSAASILLSPLLRALYSRIPELVATALDALTLIIEGGFFTKHICQMSVSTKHRTNGKGRGSSKVVESVLSDQHNDAPDSEYDIEEEATLVTAAAWSLLDVVVACAVDASTPLLEQVSESLLPFINAVLVFAGAGSSGSFSKSDHHSGHSTADETAAPPIGLHPATLHRILNAALTSHTFAHQKCIYSERGWLFCARNGKDREANGFELRYRDGRRQAAAALFALKSAVQGIVLSLERDARVPLKHSISAHIRLLFEKSEKVTESDARSSASLRRTCLGDYSYLVRAYSAHSTGSSSLCVEMHLSAESHILRRPCHSLPEEVSNVHDAFSLQHRSTSADVVVLFALLSKIAAEPLAFSNESLHSQQAGGTANSSKRLSALLLRDVAIYLLTDAFSVCGSGVASSPLITGCVTRLVCPALLSHALTHRIFHTHLSTSFGSPKQNEEAARAIMSVAAEGGSSSLQFVLAQGGLATKYSKILSESSAAGGEVGVGIALAPPMTVLRAILEVVCAMWASRGSDGETHTVSSALSNSTLDTTLLEVTPLSIREACAREISSLFRALILPILSSRAAPPAMRIDAVEAIASMVAAPQMLMEMYINHDMFPSSAAPYPHMRLLRSTVATLVATACAQRRNLDVTYGVGEEEMGVPGLDSLNIFSSASERAIVEEQALRNELAKQSALLIASIMRCLMDSAATVQMSQNNTTGFITSNTDENDIRANWLPTSLSHPSLSFGQDSLGNNRAASKNQVSQMSVRALHDAQNRSEEAFFNALPLMKEKGVRKGISPLLANGFVHKSGSGISHFLRLCGADICADTEIGDYLGDEGRSLEDQVLATSTRRELLGGISFSGMPFDAALRIMLTKCGFRLPGEAQKIDRLTSAFATAFCEDNRPNEAIMAEAQTQSDSGMASGLSHQHSVATGDGRLYPTAPDVVEILAFSVIMLNTDAHNPNIKKEKKMTRKQFVNNNRGIDKGGADLPKAFLEFLYDAIVTNEIKMQANPGAAHSPNSGSAVGLPASDGALTGGMEYVINGPPSVEALARSTGTLPLVPFGSLFASSYPESLLSQIPQTPWPTPSPFAFPCEGDGCDGPTDLPVVFRQLNQGVFRMWHHLSACSKADDRRGAVEIPLSPTAISASLSNPPAPAFFPVSYKRSFCITTVACALEDVWPHVLAMAAVLLRLQPPHSEIPAINKISAPAIVNQPITAALKAAVSVPPPAPPPPYSSSSFSSSSSSAVPTSSEIMRSMGIGMGGLIKWKIQAEKSKAPEITPPVISSFVEPDASIANFGMPVARLSSALGMGDIDVRLAALDTLKSATSAAIFLGSYNLAATGCDALLQVEALLLGVDCAIKSRDGPIGEAWHATVYSLAKKGSVQPINSSPSTSSVGFMGALRGGTKSQFNGPAKQSVEASVDAAVAVSLLHVAVSEMREAATAQAEAATLASTAARFKGELAGLLSSVSGGINSGARRLLHEGDLIKVASGGRGKQVQYRFFLFTDLLVYAQRSTFSLSDKFVARQAIPLRNMRAVPDPPELTSGQGVPPGLSFMLETSVKPLFLICSSVEDAKDWRRQIREAVAAFHHQEEKDEEEEEARKQVLSQNESIQAVSKSSITLSTTIEKPIKTDVTNTKSKTSSPTKESAILSPKKESVLLQVQSVSAIDPPKKTPVQYDSLPELKNAFMRAVAVCRPLLSSDSLPLASTLGSVDDKSPTALSDTDKLLFYGLFKQAVSGDCPIPSSEDDVSMTTSANISGESIQPRDFATASALRAKRDAWLTFKGMRRRDAMRKFVTELDRMVPGWTT